MVKKTPKILKRVYTLELGEGGIFSVSGLARALCFSGFINKGDTYFLCTLHLPPCSTTADCPEAVPSFEGSPGLTVDGQVDPPVEGVIITIELEDEERLETTTNSMGKYRYVQYAWFVLSDADGE